MQTFTTPFNDSSRAQGPTAVAARLMRTCPPLAPACFLAFLASSAPQLSIISATIRTKLPLFCSLCLLDSNDLPAPAPYRFVKLPFCSFSPLPCFFLLLLSSQTCLLVGMLARFAHETFLQLSSPPVFLFVLLCALLGTLLQFKGRSSDRRIEIKRKTGDSARTENIVGNLGNLDHAPARRRVRAAFQKELEKLNHPWFQESLDGVKAEEYYEFNSRGVEVFTRNWMPKSGLVKAIVFICHGYGDTCTFFFEGVARKLAKAGYGVFGMDYAGFGMTSGLHCYVPSFSRLVDDVLENYCKIRDRPEFKRLPCFLFGESMGGAVALKAHLKQPNAWDGAILVAPMCKIAPDMYPPWLLLQILIILSYFFPKAKLVPEKNLADLAFRDVEKRQQTAYNVAAYKDRPRLKTALELLRATDEISSRLREVSLPLLILHGEHDVVTDPSVSKALHEQAKSTDKTLHIYKDAWHSVLEGEPDGVILQVFNDIRFWLDAHSNLNTRD